MCDTREKRWPFDPLVSKLLINDEVLLLLFIHVAPNKVGGESKPKREEREMFLFMF